MVADSFAHTPDPGFRATTLGLATDEQLRGDVRALRAVEFAEKVSAVALLDMSADAPAEEQMLFAIYRTAAFKPDESDADKWLKISNWATGTANHQSFYLPASTKYGIVRSRAFFEDAFSLSKAMLQRLIEQAGTVRACGFQAEATQHLRSQLALHFSRNAREDYAWPSDEDLVLKVAWYDREIAIAQGAEKTRLETELQDLRRRLTPAGA